MATDRPYSPYRRRPITSAATEFTTSYANAMCLTSHLPTINVSLTAAALAAHYGPNTTAYTHGHSVPIGSDAVAGIAMHLQRFERSGLGCDIRMADCRVEAVSDGSAMCWITWKIRPKDKGVEGWTWENVYGYRRAVGAEMGTVKRIGGEGKEEGWEKPEGWWELIVSDNEVSGILERVPDFMEL